MKRLILITTSVALLACAANAQKLEKLSKHEKEFYGWQTSKTKFYTCEGTPIDIEDGHITRTNRECPQQPPIAGWLSATVYTGKVRDFAVTTDSAGAKVGELKLQTQDGTTHSLFVPAILMQQVNTQAIQRDATVSVRTGVEARAESVTPK